jgi:hypothetical protein
MGERLGAQPYSSGRIATGRSNDDAGTRLYQIIAHEMRYLQQLR